MAKKRVTRKQLLKEPDEFITTTGRLIAWSKANSKALGIGTTIFFVTVIAASLYVFINEKRSATAQMMLGQALVKYQTEIGATDGASAMSAVSQDFDELIKSYGSQPAGKLGRLFYGHIGSLAKDYDTAIEYYEKALVDLGDQSSLYNIIHHGLGSAYQQKGDYPKAIDHYRKIANSADSVLKDTALFNLGKLLGQIGETDESRQAYQQLSDEFPNSAFAGIARERI